MPMALIDPQSIVYNYDIDPLPLGARVCQVEEAAFPVASPLFWEPCNAEIVADQFYWNDNFFAVPTPPITAVPSLIIDGGPSIIT